MFTKFKKATFFSTLLSLGVLLGVISGSISGAIATEMRSNQPQNQSSQSTEFRRIEQPLTNHITVTTIGLGLISLEIWWFLLSKPKSPKTNSNSYSGIQEVDIAVDGGYTPSHIIVQVGKQVRLKFIRHDPSKCLEEVRLPNFRIAQYLPLHKSTTVEFTPTKLGKYEFSCSMNMFRGVVEVQENK